MRWSLLHELPAEPWHSKDLRKRRDHLNARIQAISAERVRLDGQRAELLNADVLTLSLEKLPSADQVLVGRFELLQAELALRILSFPYPVVAACHGNAYPMGAFLIMSSDHRLAAEGDYRIGMNEVAIGLTVPRFAIEVARQRLAPAYFSRVVMTAEMFGPAEAATAGFFDRVVPAERLEVELT